MGANFLLTSALRRRLRAALLDDQTLDDEDIAKVLDAMGMIPMNDIIVIRESNGTDGTTPHEIVSIALDYYGLV